MERKIYCALKVSKLLFFIIALLLSNLCEVKAQDDSWLDSIIKNKDPWKENILWIVCEDSEKSTFLIHERLYCLIGNEETSIIFEGLLNGKPDSNFKMLAFNKESIRVTSVEFFFSSKKNRFRNFRKKLNAEYGCDYDDSWDITPNDNNTNSMVYKKYQNYMNKFLKNNQILWETDCDDNKFGTEPEGYYDDND